MASTYSPNLGLELMATGEDSGTWGTKTNTNLSPLLETSIVGVSSVVYASDADKTLTITNGTDSAGRYFTLVCTGTISATRKLICPLVNKTYLVVNTTTGGQSLNVIGASGTGTIVPNGTSAFIYCDGTNYNQAITGFNDLQLVTPVLGAGTGTSLALGGATIGGDALAVTGTTALSGLLTAAGGVSSTLTTDATSATTGSIITAGGISCQKAAVVGTLLGVGMAPTNVLDITLNQNATSTISLLNNQAGGGANASVNLSNGTNNASLFMLSQGFGSSGPFQAGYTVLSSSSGIGINASSGYPILFGINSVEKARFDTSGNLCVGTTTATGRLNIGGGSIYNSTSGVFNTAGPVSITIPGDTDGFILLNAVQNGVGKVSYIIHYLNVSGTVTSNTVSTLVTGTSPITAITPGTNVITLTLFAANTNVNWGMYNGPRG